MKKQIIAILAFLGLSLTGVRTCDAYAYKWEAYKKILPDGSSQYIFVEFDLHYANLNSAIPAEQNQKRDFIECVKRLGQNTLVLGEDFGSYDGENPSFKAHSNFCSFLEPYRHFLWGLVEGCKINNIQAKSIEFRYPSNMYNPSDLPWDLYIFFILHGQYTNLRTLKNYSSTFENWLENFNNIKNELLSPLISDQDINSSHQNTIQRLINSKVNEIISNNQPALNCKNKNLLTDKDKENLSEIEKDFIELLAMKRIAQNTKKQAIFICLGGQHSANLCSILKEAEYQYLDRLCIPGCEGKSNIDRALFLNSYLSKNKTALQDNNQFHITTFISKLNNAKLLSQLNITADSQTIIQLLPEFKTKVWISAKTIERCLIGCQATGLITGLIGLVMLKHKLSHRFARK